MYVFCFIISHQFLPKLSILSACSWKASRKLCVCWKSIWLGRLFYFSVKTASHPSFLSTTPLQVEASNQCLSTNNFGLDCPIFFKYAGHLGAFIFNHLKWSCSAQLQHVSLILCVIFSYVATSILFSRKFYLLRQECATRNMIIVQIASLNWLLSVSDACENES